MALRTADRIAEQARVILLAEGVEAVSMRRVAGAAGVTAMAIYRHYPNREALLGAVADRGRAELAERWRRRPRQDDPRAELRAVLNALLDFALEQPQLYALLHSEPALDEDGVSRDFRSDDSPALNAVVAAIDEGMHRGVFAPDDVWETALTIVALLHGLIGLHHAGRLGLSDPEFRVLCGTAMTRLLHGIAP